MVIEVVDLGRDLEYLINYSTGSFFPLAETAAHGRHLIAYEPLHTFTVFYLKGRNLKVVPKIDLRFLKPPKAKLQIPDYDNVRGGSVKEFVFVSPMDCLDDREYAVFTDDPRYDPQDVYKEVDLKYMGSPLRTALDINEAKRHKVLMAAFDSDRHALHDFLQAMKNDAGRDLRVNVNISRSKRPLFTTCSLVRYKARKKPHDTLVVKAKDLGERFLYDEQG